MEKNKFGCATTVNVLQPFVTQLVGDVKGPMDIYVDHKRVNEFFKELEALMTKYRVEKIDVSWSRFRANPTHSQSPAGG